LRKQFELPQQRRTVERSSYWLKKGGSLVRISSKEGEPVSSSPSINNLMFTGRASDGTTHVIFEPLDVIAKLAALIPKPGVNLTRFRGVFVGVPHQPNSKYRLNVTPARRGNGRPRHKEENKHPEQRHQTMIWAQRLKRVFTNRKRFRRHRCIDLPSVWRRSPGNRRYVGPLHRRSADD
jgi:hypothetical protein